MIARTWIVDVDPAGLETYETFAREVSVPMFKQQAGFCGVLMMRDGATCQVVSLWSDREAVAALDTSSSYRATVAAIEVLGILSHARPVELFEVHEFETIA